MARDERRAWLTVAALLLLTLGLAFHEGLMGRAAIDGARLYPEAFAEHPRPADVRMGLPDMASPLAFQPWDAFLIRTLHAGSFPLWQPHNAFGHPLLGNGQSGMLNPFKLLLWNGAAGHAQHLAWFLVARLAFAMAGCLLLARRLGLSAWAGGLLALAFALQGDILANFDLAATPAMVFLPWLVWAGEGVVQRPDAARAAAFGLLIALTGLVGHAEAALFAAGGAGLAAAAAIASHPARKRLTAALAGAALLGAAGALIVVLPFAELVKSGTSYLLDRAHSTLASASQLWDAPTVRWLLRRHLLAADAGPMQPYFNPYVGIVPLALAVAGVWGAGVTRIAAALAGAAVLLLVLCPPAGILAALPGAPNAFYVMPLLALAIGLCGAAGLDRLLARPRGPAWLGVGLMSLAIARQAWVLHREQAAMVAADPASYLAGLSGVGFLLAAVMAGVLAALGLVGWRLALGGRWLAPLLVVAAAGNMAFMARWLVPPLPPFTYPATPIVRALQAAPGPVRVASGQGAFEPSTNLVHGVEHLGLVEAFFIARYHLFDQALHPAFGRIDNNRTLRPGFQPDLLDLANVGWIVAPAPEAASDPKAARALTAQLAAAPARFVPTIRLPRATLYRNQRVLPRARVLYQAEHLPVDPAAAARRLAQVPARWREVALVEAEPPAGWADAPLPPTPATSVTREGPQVLRVVAEAARPGWWSRRLTTRAGRRSWTGWRWRSPPPTWPSARSCCQPAATRWYSATGRAA